MVYKIAVIGATGLVGREMLSVLSERNFPASEVVPLATQRSVGVKVGYGNKKLSVLATEDYDFNDIDICMMSAGSATSKVWCPRLCQLGCTVIDNSSAWRYHNDIPLVVAEVNADSISAYANKNIIANPNCSVIQLVVALKPLHELARIKRVIVSSYQSASGIGQKGIDTLYTQAQEVLSRSYPFKKETQQTNKQLAFNVVPHIDVFTEDGYTREEWKIKVETQKILNDHSIKIAATAARVPVFIGHAEAINVEFADPITDKEAREILRKAPGCQVLDNREEPNCYITPYEAAGKDKVYISRIREDTSTKNGLVMWVVADNLKKGAALNAIQTAEILVNKKLISPKAA